MLTFMTINTALLRDYSPLASLNKALSRPYFFGGGLLYVPISRDSLPGQMKANGPLIGP